MARRTTGKLQLTHAEQALSKIMGEVVTLPRRGAPKEPNLNTKSRIRVRHIAGGGDYTFGAIFDVEANPPTLYVNTTSRWREPVPLEQRLAACEAILAHDGEMLPIYAPGGKSQRYKLLVCPYCNVRLDETATGQPEAIGTMRHLIDCFSRFDMFVARFTGPQAFAIRHHH